MSGPLTKPQKHEEPNAGFAAPRSVYIHVPFCRHRCGYCNFTLVAGRDDLICDYLRAIEIELSALQRPHEVDTLYFGGGTPTHLSPSQFRQLADIVLKWFPLSINSPSLIGRGQVARNSPWRGRARTSYEFTVEANPADVSMEMIATLTDIGVTRLSLGGQSFRTEKLLVLERDHDTTTICRSVELARQAGMQVSLDLMFATPGETLDEWRQDLEAAIALAPDHLSTYGLTFEQGTAFWNRKSQDVLIEADEELQRGMYALTIDRLTEAGYEHYEVSNFARRGCRSRHNQVYWSGDGYFAAGPGASRYVSGIRETNHRSTTTYLDRVLSGQSPVAEREELAPEARAREFLVFSLRRLEGITRHTFRTRTGYEIEDLVAHPLQKFLDLGLLTNDGDHIRLTREGLYVSDAMWPELL